METDQPRAKYFPISDYEPQGMYLLSMAVNDSSSTMAVRGLPSLIALFYMYMTCVFLFDEYGDYCIYL